jgi:hypothetical protein
MGLGRAGLAVTLGMFLAALPFAACSAGDGGVDGNDGGGGVSFDGGSGGGPGPDSECAIGTDEARLVQVNLYIMYDKSGSMLGPKWTESTKALQAFFMDPDSAGLRVALRFFPDTGCDTSCNVNACAQPLVPLGELTELSAPTDAQEQALIDAFIDQTPAGGTPLSAALDGAISWAGGVLDQSPYDKAVVVLVTDGQPEDCQDSTSYFVGQAENALSSRGILTFAIGLEGSNNALMNAIAAAGGTEDAFFIGTANFQEELIAALQAIRELAIACEYDVPQQYNSSPIDPEEVNVLYTPSGGSSSITIGKVPNASACGEATGGGWYYDDPISPSSIIFCPDTCEAVQQDLEAEIELLFGCSTVPA